MASKKTIVVSAEMNRLLILLALYPDGATRRELVMQDVRGSLIYEAVMLSLVRVVRERVFEPDGYRFQILPARMELLGVQE
jgi:hypothetical protein